MKLPRTGVLCHQPTLELFRDIFPPGVVNIVAGSGRETLQPIMNSGVIDVFSFIGTSNAADSLQRAHPRPHRLRVCLGLEAKNAGIVLKSADVDLAVSECLLGSLSFNGQRCTAIKIILVHESIVDQFLPKFCAAVDALKMGLPWEAGVKITPLPEEAKPKFIADLVDDAIAKGARVVNSKYGWDRTFVRPAVVFPVNSSMRVYNEEQFGPLVPVMTFKNIDEVFDYYAKYTHTHTRTRTHTHTHTRSCNRLVKTGRRMVSRLRCSDVILTNCRC
jgi:glyceraldehyde-3-phosphate dehydrogenase (NADP+)